MQICYVVVRTLTFENDGDEPLQVIRLERQSVEFEARPGREAPKLPVVARAIRPAPRGSDVYPADSTDVHRQTFAVWVNAHNFSSDTSQLP